MRPFLLQRRKDAVPVAHPLPGMPPPRRLNTANGMVWIGKSVPAASADAARLRSA
jgi:hypothetical protein